MIRRTPTPQGSPTGDVDQLRRRLRALHDIADLGEGRLDEAVLARIRTTTQTASERLGHGTSHTVVALAGATGSGKSSLFNAITGTEWATTGMRRPTTSSPLAAVYGDGAQDLLDWLDIPNRQRHEGGDLTGLVLLDLPDHDSKVIAHRAEVDRLVAVVDVFAWVVDPQKYADAALHEGYLRQFGGHGAVTMVLLNQIDRLDAEARAGTVAHLGRLLAEDGLSEVRVIPTSATTGEGVEALRRELTARVAERRAIVTRIDADIDWLATDLTSSLAGLADRSVSPAARDRVVLAATEAAGGASRGGRGRLVPASRFARRRLAAAALDPQGQARPVGSAGTEHPASGRRRTGAECRAARGGRRPPDGDRRQPAGRGPAGGVAASPGSGRRPRPARGGAVAAGVGGRGHPCRSAGCPGRGRRAHRSAPRPAALVAGDRRAVGRRRGAAGRSGLAAGVVGSGVAAVPAAAHPPLARHPAAQSARGRRRGDRCAARRPGPPTHRRGGPRAARGWPGLARRARGVRYRRGRRADRDQRTGLPQRVAPRAGATVSSNDHGTICALDLGRFCH
ncbi:MAG: 50S ribosome-binding GTPase [Kineosporiaceae bacterium]|nr:50S ribosome-binding GTPase [Kineosporiaceae bacterium]